MARPSSTRSLAVWMNGERVGTWTTQPSRPDTFAYAESWLASRQVRAISLSLPLQPTPHSGAKVAAYFDNLLPENRQIRERVQRRFGTASTRAFDLLLAIGRDCIGAIQLTSPEADPPDPKRIEGSRRTSTQIGQLLADFRSPRPLGADGDEFRISLAGAQEKTALLKIDGRWMAPAGATPTTHILKLPIGIGNRGVDLTTSLENEWLCAQILAAYGVPIASCAIETFGDQRALVVERFDRRLASDGSWIIRLPQEDFCQVTGTPPEEKYQDDGGPGIRDIMTLLLGSSAAEADRKDFFRTQILFWMLCAIDGHAKNFSIFLEPGGGFRLTPRYDVISAFPMIGRKAGMLQERKVAMAMAAEGKNRHYRWTSILPRHWESTARLCGLAPVYPALRDELIERTPAVISAVQDRLPRAFPESISASILKGLARSADRLKTGR